MQTVETLNEGLKRAYAVTIPANDVAKRVEAEIKSIAPQIRMPGFRPGKVPTNLVKKMHGPAIEQDVLNKTVKEHIGAASVVGDAKVSKVSVVGVGMRSHVGIASAMFRTLSEEGVNIQMISTSEIKISVLIDEKYMELAVRALHKAFDLEKAE